MNPRTAAEAVTQNQPQEGVMTPEERATKAVGNLLRVGALASADKRPEIEAEIARQIGEVSEKRGSAIEYGLIAVLVTFFAVYCSSMFR